MFCPKCGCLLKEGTSLCRECGYIIPKNMKNDLSEKQPANKPWQNLTPKARNYVLMRIAGLISSTVMICCILTPWGTCDIPGISDTFRALDIINMDWTGAMGFLKYTVAIVPVLGLIGIVCLSIGGRGWFGAAGFLAGLMGVFLTFSFCIEFDGYFGCEIGISPYLCIIFGMILAVTSAYCRVPKRDLVL